jgi:hypothetical protein
MNKDNAIKIKPIINSIWKADEVTFHGIKTTPNTLIINPIVDKVIIHISIVKAFREFKQRKKSINLIAIFKLLFYYLFI